MGLIATSKYGDCDRCPAKNTACRKRKKEMLCLNCCKVEDNKKSIAKQRDKGQVRLLVNNEDESKALSIIQGNAELERWFKDRRNEMTGICKHCGGKSEKNSDKYYKFSIAHLLPKFFFKSVKTHPDNWIELCHFNKSCHANFDNCMIDIIDLNCFNDVIEKFVSMYPFIDEKEKRRIPSVLMQYVETEI